MRGIAGRLTYANVLATAALMVALGGTGYAATTIGTGQIRDGAVTTAKIRDRAVTTTKLAGRSVTADKLAPGSLRASLFAAGQRPGLDPAKVFITSQSYTLPANTAMPGWAYCPRGTYVIAGGFTVPGPVVPQGSTVVDRDTAAMVLASRPTGQDTITGRDDTWEVSVLAGTFSAQVTVYAICVAP